MTRWVLVTVWNSELAWRALRTNGTHWGSSGEKRSEYTGKGLGGKNKTGTQTSAQKSSLLLSWEEKGRRGGGGGIDGRCQSRMRKICVILG